MFNKFILPASLLSGFIIGAGIFSLPFVFEASGLLLGFLYLGLATLVYIILHMMYADVILRTPGNHEFVGYARQYLGRSAGAFTVLLAVIEMIFVLTAFLVLSISFSNLLFPGGSAIVRLLIFWVVSSATIYLSLKRIASLEFLIMGGMVAVIGFIFIFGAPALPNVQFSLTNKLSNTILPLAPILFALSGRVAVYSLVSFLGKNREAVPRIKRAITWGTIFPALIYALFVLAVVALTSPTTEDAVTGLVGALPAWSLPLIGVLGLISLWSSYVLAGLSVRNILMLDLKLPNIIDAAVVLVGPPLLYFLGFQHFLHLVGIIGGVFLAIEGLIIVLMWIRSKKVSGSPFLIKSISPITLGLVAVTLLVAFGNEIIKLLT